MKLGKEYNRSFNESNPGSQYTGRSLYGLQALIPSYRLIQARNETDYEKHFLLSYAALERLLKCLYD
jgi:hypothetical protein